MYRVLLVDDEALTREAISENTRWNDLGYELMGTCKNGKEAIAFMKEQSIDLLLTDICMPFCDGMELTKFAYENYRETKTIIISGYDEFEYAKKAVKYQVAEYILKPITARELSETLQKIKETLDEEKIKQQSMKKIRGAYVRNLPLLRGRFLNSLLAGNVQTEELEEKMVDYGMELCGERFMTAMVLGDDLRFFLAQSKDIKPELAYFAIYNIAEEIMRTNQCGTAFQDVNEKTILIFCGRAGLEKKALQICEEIQESLLKYLRIESTIAVGQAVKSLVDISKSFSETKQAMEYKFLLGGKQVIYAANLRGQGKQIQLESNKHIEKVILAIKRDNEAEITQTVKGLMQSIKEAYVSKNRSIFYVQNAVLAIMNELDTMLAGEPQIFGRGREFLGEIYEKEHLNEIEEELIIFCNEMKESTKSQKESYCKKQAVQALDYIEKNYGNTSLSLQSVCTHLAMSTSYFSSVFKSYTGETFIEALTKKRMETAKMLIENTSKKTYEIADEVGYSDPHYFSSAFKKFTGMTPTEYAKKGETR